MPSGRSQLGTAVGEGAEKVVDTESSLFLHGAEVPQKFLHRKSAGFAKKGMGAGRLTFCSDSFSLHSSAKSAFSCSVGSMSFPLASFFFLRTGLRSTRP